jgi:phospholipid/cholesterol/gamma-HCH transport system substrate-binding protein
MQKQPPTIGRLLVMSGFALACFGVLLFLWISFGGYIPLKAKGYQFTANFGEATQLAQQADVRISGVPVGKVVRIGLGPGETTAVTMQIDERYAPIPKDARAILRTKTLLGETYIELTPGNKSAGTIPEGGTLPLAQVDRTVELDEIFRSLDEPTRRSFQVWMQALALGMEGRGADLNFAFGSLAPFAEEADRLVEVLYRQEPYLTALVRNTGIAFGALSERTGQLTSLIRDANTVFGTVAQRNEQLQATFKALPTFERESTLTLERLDRFADDTEPLVEQLKPVARELSPTFEAAAELAPTFRRFFVVLGPLVEAARPGLPAFQRILNDLRPVLGQLGAFTRSLNPFLDYLTDYLPELDAFLGNTAAATQAAALVTSGGRDQLVHYARALGTYGFGRFDLSRPNPYRFPGAADKLAEGLAVFENRQCANGPTPVPQLPPDLPTIIGGLTPNAGSQILELAFRNDPLNVPAPPCRYQGPTPGFGTDYPHVVAQAPPQR